MKKKQRIKKALVSSALALILCVSMLVGNTFAWFTDTASTSVNRIQAGTLDVALKMKDSNDEWVSAEGKILDFVKATDGKDQTILWEPGCTYSLPTVKVVNEGSLALKYTVQINGVVVDDEDVDLSEVLELSMSVNGTKVFPKEEEVVTLKDALTSQDPDGFAHGNLKAGEDSGELTISLHMQETAGNEYQGKTIRGISVTVFATQDTVEYDSNSNTYDKNASVNGSPVSTTEEFLNAISEGKNEIALTSNITLSFPVEITGNVVIRSTGAVIAPATGYTGTLFNVAANASLTLEQVIVSGKNAWSWTGDNNLKSVSMPLTDDEKGYDITKAVSSSGTELTAPLIKSAGTLVLGDDCVIENVYYAGEWGKNPIVSISGGTLTIDGATVRNTLGTIFSISNAAVIIEDCNISNNFAYNSNKGGIIALFNSTCVMNGGTITQNAGHVRSGLVFGVMNGSKLTINNGTISQNYAKYRGSSTGSVVCCETGGNFEMNGGSIVNNRGVLAGAFSARWVLNDGASNSCITLNGGTISGNTCIQDTWHNPEIFIRDTVTTIGSSMVIGGNVVLDSGKPNLTNNGTVNGNVFVQNPNATMTNNGTVSGNVTVTKGEFTNKGTVSGDVTVTAGKFTNNGTVTGTTTKTSD